MASFLCLVSFLLLLLLFVYLLRMHNHGLYGQSLYGVLDSPDKLGMVPTVVWGEYITPWARRGGSSPFFDSTPDHLGVGPG